MAVGDLLDLTWRSAFGLAPRGEPLAFPSASLAPAAPDRDGRQPCTARRRSRSAGSPAWWRGATASAPAPAPKATRRCARRLDKPWAKAAIFTFLLGLGTAAEFLFGNPALALWHKLAIAAGTGLFVQFPIYQII